MAHNSQPPSSSDGEQGGRYSHSVNGSRRTADPYSARSLSPIEGEYDRDNDEIEQRSRLAERVSPIMRQENRSASVLSSHRNQQVNDVAPPMPPPYDPVNQLNFEDLRVSDAVQSHSGPANHHDRERIPPNSTTVLSYQPNFQPPPRGSSAMGYVEPPPRGQSAMGYQSYEPIARAGTSMSMQSRHQPPRQPHQQWHPQPPTRSQYAQPSNAAYYPSDSASIRSLDRDAGQGYSGGPSNRNSGYDAESVYDQYFDDRASVYSQDARPPPNHAYHQGYGHPPPHGYYPPPQQYDPMYAAASDILGNSPYGGSQASSTSGQYPHYPPAVPYGYPSGGPGYYAAPSIHSVSTSELPARPGLERAGTTLSNMTLATKKTKAIDLTQQPYTKEYVDQYRTRIKGDPDPEAHFQYAKYLIECAKHIGANSPDQKAVRKYRDGLVAEALKVIRRLATQGEAYAEAQFFLANCCGTGMLGLPVDHERAYHLYLQAVKQNHPAATYRVAVCNEIGAGTKRDYGRAYNFFSRAAALGDTAAMYKLGMILLTGSMGHQKDPRQAIGWIKRAAEQADEENPHALHELGLLHEMPNSSVVVHDEAYAKDLFTRAAQLGYTQSQFKLGTCYEYGTLTCPVDPRRSIAWYTKAAEKQDPEAELALSGWYLTGSEGVLKQSDSEAYLWARKAANKGLAKAEYAVGYYAEVGIGVKQDIEFAKRWYMRAAAQGNKRAMNRLTELKRQGNRRPPTVARPTRQQAKDEGCIVF